MSSQSEVSVCNLALLSIGARVQISSVNPSDGSTAGDACSTLYTFIFEMFARAAQWGCLKKQATLSLVQAAQGTPENLSGTSLPQPPQPWLYAYLYPSDCLYLRQIVCPAVPTQFGPIPQLSVPNGVAPVIPEANYQIPYQIAYSTDSSGNPIQIILTNQESALANYTVNQPNPVYWDSLFTAGFVATMAVYLAPALNLNTPLIANCKAQAESVVAIARAQDGNESPTSQDVVPDWIQARQGASGFSNWWGPKMNAYGNILWPG